jgi:hypothetical protein
MFIAGDAQHSLPALWILAALVGDGCCHISGFEAALLGMAFAESQHFFESANFQSLLYSRVYQLVETDMLLSGRFLCTGQECRGDKGV